LSLTTEGFYVTDVNEAGDFELENILSCRRRLPKSEDDSCKPVKKRSIIVRLQKPASSDELLDSRFQVSIATKLRCTMKPTRLR